LDALSPFLLARRRGFEVRTFDVRFLPRAHGESRWAFSLGSRARHVGRALGFMRAMGRGKGGI